MNELHLIQNLSLVNVNRNRLETPKENGITLSSNLDTLLAWVEKRRELLEKEKPVAGDYKSVVKLVSTELLTYYLQECDD